MPDQHPLSPSPCFYWRGCFIEWFQWNPGEGELGGWGCNRNTCEPNSRNCAFSTAGLVPTAPFEGLWGRGNMQRPWFIFHLAFGNIKIQPYLFTINAVAVHLYWCWHLDYPSWCEAWKHPGLQAWNCKTLWLWVSLLFLSSIFCLSLSFLKIRHILGSRMI